MNRRPNRSEISPCAAVPSAKPKTVALPIAATSAPDAKPDRWERSCEHVGRIFSEDLARELGPDVRGIIDPYVYLTPAARALPEPAATKLRATLAATILRHPEVARRMHAEATEVLGDRKPGHDDLSRRSAFLHMLGDAAVAAGVLISGGLIVLTHWDWLDPAVSLAVVAVILVSTWSLLRDSVHLSLDGVPSGVNSGAVMSFLAGQRGVTDVHDLHIWALSTTSVALTAHLVVPEREAEDELLHTLAPFLKKRFHIDHATLQIERDRCDHGCEA